MRSSFLALFLCCFVTPCCLSQDPEFSVEVMSILSKAGCNAGTCHGNLNGKGGLKLSLRGQDPHHDYEQLVVASRGRRINRNAPSRSLLLEKATGMTAHIGGQRFSTFTPEYEELMRWLEHGAPPPQASDRQLERLEVEPRSVVVVAPYNELQIRATAYFSNGEEQDVTTRACYELSNLNATVDSDGRVTRSKFGETTLIVRYLGIQIPVAIAFREANPEYQWSAPVEANFVDEHVFAKLKRLRINPSPTCSDSEFLRRAYLDAIGRLPSVEEVRLFLADSSPDKRTAVVEHLLHRPEFADFWALKYADILRVEEKVLDPQGVEIFHEWIRSSIDKGVALDEMVRQLVTGTGSTFEHPPANFYRANRDPSTRGETTARLFLGTRIQCARCHNHPYDQWTQQDYYQWANLFSQIDYEIGENKRRDKLDKNEFRGEQTVLITAKAEVKNPSTGSEVIPKFLGGRTLNAAEKPQRLNALAHWLTAPENDLFVQSQVNFVWFHLMGKGLVDPVDDFRITNPPSNEPLLNALAASFVESGFDLRDLVHTMMVSETYQLSSRPTQSNQSDETNFSRAYVRRYPAEVLLDMQSDVLALPAEFAGFERGIRAVQLPGIEKVRKRDQAPLSGDRFLRTFGKPQRILACDCERSNETNLKQVLGLVGSELDARLESSPQLKGLANSAQDDVEIVNELYLAALSRKPTSQEQAAALASIRQQGRLVGIQDVTWALMNAKEFIFRR